MSMITPAEARRRILATASVVADIELVGLGRCLGRTLGRDLHALHTQPSFRASAMDGYAVRADDLAIGFPLKLVGQSAAGHPFGGTVGPSETVRIFTGGMVPEGADTILIQENAERLSDNAIAPSQREHKGRFVRAVGLDFHKGEVLLKAGLLLDARHIGLSASMGHSVLPVRRRPRVAVLSTGDELVLPGEVLQQGQIICSNNYALAAEVTRAGGDPVDLGIVPDTLNATCEARCDHAFSTPMMSFSS